MGPRLGSRGDWSAETITARQHALQWGRDLGVAETRCATAGEEAIGGFNGAATWESRRRRSCHRSRSGPSSFNGAATWESRRRLLSQCPEPLGGTLQWGRDLGVAETLPQYGAGTALRGFNGAATWESRRRGRSPQELQVPPASMGPRLGSRGDTEGIFPHTLVDASMGPRLGSRGDMSRRHPDWDSTI